MDSALRMVKRKPLKYEKFGYKREVWTCGSLLVILVIQQIDALHRGDPHNPYFFSLSFIFLGSIAQDLNRKWNLEGPEEMVCSLDEWDSLKGF